MPKRSRPRDRDRKGASDPLACKGWEGGRTVGETLNPQAGKPASIVNGRTGCFAAGRGMAPVCVSPDWTRAMAAILYVCTTCKAGEITSEGVAGARLFAALGDQPLPEGVRIVGVECLSACSQGAAVALHAQGKWGYVYGRLTEADAPDIIAGATAYAASPDGIVPWRERPIIFRKQSLARIPPLEA